MHTNILLTGAPGSGKTTVIRRAIEGLDGVGGGFFTQEIRIDGDRRGFKMLTLDGDEGILAHVDIEGPPRVSRYGVDVAALEAVGVASIRRALTGTGLIVIDELGPMEFFSAAFKQAVLDALDSDQRVLGTIVQRSTPFGDQIKARPDVTVIDVHPSNRDTLADELRARLRES